MQEVTLRNSSNLIYVATLLFGFFGVGPLPIHLSIKEEIKLPTQVNIPLGPLYKASSNLHAFFLNEKNEHASEMAIASMQSSEVNEGPKILILDEVSDSIPIPMSSAIAQTPAAAPMTFQNSQEKPQQKPALADQVTTSQASEFWNPKLVSPRVNDVIEREIARSKIQVPDHGPEKKAESKKTDDNVAAVEQITDAIRFKMIGLKESGPVPSDEDVITGEFIPAYSSRNEGILGDTEGILIDSINSYKDILISGRFIAKDYLSSDVHLFFKKGMGHLEAVIPLLERNWLEKFLSEKDVIMENPGIVFIELGEGKDLIKNIEIDRVYSKLFFLDQELKEVELLANAKFALYLGVQPGNCLLTYLFNDGRYQSKIIMVTDSATTYDLADIRKKSEMPFEMFLERPMLLKEARLEIVASKIKNITGSSSIYKRGLGRYLLSESYDLGSSNKYFELGHHDFPLFVGYQDSNHFQVPDDGFIQYVQQTLGLKNLEGQCLIQVNLPSDTYVENVEANARNGERGIALESFYLDVNGTFSDYIDGETRKIFFVAQESGKIDFNLEMNDKSSQAFQTFCSLGTYLIEQI